MIFKNDETSLRLDITSYEFPLDNGEPGITGRCSHLPPQRTSLCLVSHSCINWPLPAEREPGRQTS